jgi:hypothetical protein
MREGREDVNLIDSRVRLDEVRALHLFVFEVPVGRMGGLNWGGGVRGGVRVLERGVAQLSMSSQIQFILLIHLFKLQILIGPIRGLRHLHCLLE